MKADYERKQRKGGKSQGRKEDKKNSSSLRVTFDLRVPDVSGANLVFAALGQAKEDVGPVFADVFEIAVEALFRAFDGDALEEIEAGNVQANELQETFEAEAE